MNDKMMSSNLDKHKVTNINIALIDHNCFIIYINKLVQEEMQLFNQDKLAKRNLGSLEIKTKIKVDNLFGLNFNRIKVTLQKYLSKSLLKFNT